MAPATFPSAEGWSELLLPEIERQQEQGKEVVFRADAAFARPKLYEALEERAAGGTVEQKLGQNLAEVGRLVYKRS